MVEGRGEEEEGEEEGQIRDGNRGEIIKGG